MKAKFVSADRARVNEVAARDIFLLLRSGATPEYGVAMGESTELRDDVEMRAGPIERALMEGEQMLRYIAGGVFPDGNETRHAAQMTRPFRVDQRKKKEESLP